MARRKQKEKEKNEVEGGVVVKANMASFRIYKKKKRRKRKLMEQRNTIETDENRTEETRRVKKYAEKRVKQKEEKRNAGTVRYDWYKREGEVELGGRN